jgi:hypothetical protein
MCKTLHEAGRDEERQLSLAAPARSSEGHQTPRCLQYQITNRGAVLLAADQVRVRRWQVVVACRRHVARSPSNSVRGHSSIPRNKVSASSSLGVRYSAYMRPGKHADPRFVTARRWTTPRLTVPPGRVVLGHVASNGLGAGSGVTLQ